MWRAEAGENSRTAPIVVVATGWADYPHAPHMAGHGDVRRPDPAFEPLSQSRLLSSGKRTLVVGYGNSGAEIALDLAEAGIDVVLSVRSPVNIVPRELFGVPILVFPAAEQWLPAARRRRASTRPWSGSRSARMRKARPDARLPRDRSNPSRRTGACRSSTSARSTRYATDGSSFAATSRALAGERRFQTVACRALRRDHSRDWLPSGPAGAAAGRQGRAERNGSAARQRPSDGRARPFLLRRHSLGARAISSDRHRGDPHR